MTRTSPVPTGWPGCAGGSGVTRRSRCGGRCTFRSTETASSLDGSGPRPGSEDAHSNVRPTLRKWQILRRRGLFLRRADFGRPGPRSSRNSTGRTRGCFRRQRTWPLARRSGKTDLRWGLSSTASASVMPLDEIHPLPKSGIPLRGVAHPVPKGMPGPGPRDPNPEHPLFGRSPEAPWKLGSFFLISQWPNGLGLRLHHVP